MQDFLIVGVDVSKTTLDICIKPMETLLRIDNTSRGFSCWYQQLQNLCLPEAKILVVLEHTGRYSNRFENFLHAKGIGFCKIPALQIKRSLGVLRGKNDTIDAQRIAEYGWLRRDILQADPVIEKEVGELKSLLSLRSKLVRDRSGYQCRLKEIKATSDVVMAIELKVVQQTIAFLTAKIEKINTSIQMLIAANEALSKTSSLLTSMKGVGWVVAAYMIACTANFKRFRNARKFNCYAGLAPFKNESGTSIRGRSRVSHLANKEVKTILNLAASCAIQHDAELSQYYQRRVSEGKRK